MKEILIFIGALVGGGTIGMFAMSLAAASKVEPPPLARDIKMTKNPSYRADNENPRNHDDS